MAAFGCPPRIKEVEKVMSERFEQKERRVLQKLYEVRDSHPQGVVPDELAAALNLRIDEVYQIIAELEEKKWIGGNDEASWILPAGIKEIERIPETPTPNIIINNPQNSPISLGAHSNQTVTYNNQSVQEILPALTHLIQDLYALDSPTRGDAIAELQKVESLAKDEMNAGKWQMIQSRLLTTKTALEIAKLGADSLPYWPIVWNFFFK
jgi:hypothetical protein